MSELSASDDDVVVAAGLDVIFGSVVVLVAVASAMTTCVVLSAVAMLTTAVAEPKVCVMTAPGVRVLEPSMYSPPEFCETVSRPMVRIVDAPVMVESAGEDVMTAAEAKDSVVGDASVPA